MALRTDRELFAISRCIDRRHVHDGPRTAPHRRAMRHLLGRSSSEHCRTVCIDYAGKALRALLTDDPALVEVFSCRTTGLLGRALQEVFPLRPIGDGQFAARPTHSAAAPARLPCGRDAACPLGFAFALGQHAVLSRLPRVRFGYGHVQPGFDASIRCSRADFGVAGGRQQEGSGAPSRSLATR
jgi:hypothetical protein